MSFWNGKFDELIHTIKPASNQQMRSTTQPNRTGRRQRMANQFYPGNVTDRPAEHRLVLEAERHWELTPDDTKSDPRPNQTGHE